MGMLNFTTMLLALPMKFWISVLAILFASYAFCQFEVTNTNDTGAGSLREAIAQANASMGQETITFNIPGTGPWVIALASTITIDNSSDVGMVIDGTTQPNFTQWQDMVQIVGPSGSTAILISEPGVEIYGLHFIGGRYCLQTNANSDGFVIGSATDGNAFQSATQFMLNISNTDGGVLYGNRIGTSLDGLSVTGTGSASDGVYLSSTNNITIGGVGLGNLISGNGDSGTEYAIDLNSADNTIIKGNLIGTDINGNNDLGNNRGINVSTSDLVQIGGLLSGEGNVISGNGNNGITVQASPVDLTIEGNIIGLNSSGDTAIPNTGDGIGFAANADGANPVIRGNVISGNGGSGMFIDGVVSNLLIEDNFIGTDINGEPGSVFLGNQGNGIGFRSSFGTDNGTGRIQILNNIISGNGDAINDRGIYWVISGSNFLIQDNSVGVDINGDPLGNGGNGIEINLNLTNIEIGGSSNPNIIANNGASGILMDGASAASLSTTIGLNSFFCNTGEAIEYTLTPSVDPPVITSRTTTSISGTSTAVAGSIVDVFITDPACDDNQGKTHLGQATVSGGFWSLGGSFSLVDAHTATVTDASDGISEFGAAVSLAPFITTWSTTDGEINIPTKSGETYNYDIIWTNLTNATQGDGSITGQAGDYLITGLNNGDIYQIEISGTFPSIEFANNASERDKILTVEQWGDISWLSFQNAFYGCSNLTITAADAPDLTLVTDMSSSFQNATSFNQSIEHWDVSNVQDFSNMFRGASLFDQPLDGWTVSAALDMSHMFRDADAFNRDLNSWVPSLVQDMSRMFYSAGSFDGAIGNWDVSSVLTMESMFFLATDFNQPLAGWSATTGMVQDMSQMFRQATSFDQPLNAWDVSSVSDMSGMFLGATSFDQDLNGWITSNLQNLSNTFQNATLFDGQIDNWDVDQVTTFAFMFDGASSFDQPLNNWTVTGALSFQNMFRDADAFNQNLDLWTPIMVTDMFGMFQNCLLFDGDITTWDVTSVDYMGNMFFLATAFNQEIGSWGTTTGGVMDMGSMFRQATSFNRDISAWDVSSVTDMSNMFDEATAFNQDISGWTTTSVQSLSNTFRLAAVFDQNLGGWDLTNVTTMVAMLNNSGLSVNNYDATLIGWEAQNPPTGLTLGATGLYYCYSEAERTELQNLGTHNWTINDAGAQCPYEVTNTNDSGVGSLRWVIDNANSDPDVNTISFNIPNSDGGYSISSGNEQWTIQPATNLPAITEGVVIDATTQPGSGSYRIKIDGQGTLNTGFNVNHSAEIYGFEITGFNANSSSTAVYFFLTDAPSQIGDVGKGNVLNGNRNGIYSLQGNLDLFKGNLIGTDTSGTMAIPNNTGIFLGTGSNNALIGGSLAGEGNLISGNSGAGIGTNASGGHTIEGNLIGTDITGLIALPNGGGIGLSTGLGCTVQNNTISGNTNAGISLNTHTNSFFYGNNIGVGSDGSTPVPNNIGVTTVGVAGGGCDDNRFGGTGLGQPNIIAYNTSIAIELIHAIHDGNQFIANEMFCNGDGIVLNGGNNGILPPVIDEVTATTVGGTGVASEEIHVYRDNSACTPYQGQEYLGTTTVGAGGDWQLTGLSISVGTDVITATATSADDGTSEFASHESFIVTNTLDDGIGSMRWCIDNANLDASLNTISFNIPTSDPNYDAGTERWTITLDSDLPLITFSSGGVIIDATTQPGTADFRVILDGQGARTNGLTLQGPSEVYGMWITGFTGGGIYYGGFQNGPAVFGSSGKGNLLSGNNYGIHLFNSSNITIQSNLIGTDPTGLVAEPNNLGIFAEGNGVAFPYVQGYVIGGSLASERNLISGNTNDAIVLFHNNGALVEGNWIGVDATGNAALPNDDGVVLSVGINAIIRNNVISGNTNRGVYLASAADNQLLGNLIGVGEDGTTNVGNQNGIYFEPSGSANLDNVIGGIGVGEANIIANNTTNGVIISNSLGASVIGNSIYCNGDGIVLSAGSNNDIQPPVIDEVTATTVGGTGVDGNQIHIYRNNSVCSPAQGLEYLGTTTVSGGVWQLTGLSISLGADIITATATNATDGTSEFTQALYVVTNTLDDGVGSLRWCIANANASTTKETISFAIPGSGPWQIDLQSELLIDNPNNVGLEIDGLTQAGSTFGGNMVILDGTAFTTPNGLAIEEPDVEIYGLYIRGFSNGILTDNGSQDLVIGSPGRGNIISGNTSEGLFLDGSTDAMIQSNRIGTSLDGLSADGNGNYGIWVRNCDGIQIGGNRLAGEGNTISGNGAASQYAIRVRPTNNVSIFGNLIGTDVTGNNNLGNAGGILVEENCDNIVIGGAGTGQGNVISGCFSVAAIRATTNAGAGNDGLTIENNLIGLNLDGDIPIPNSNRGIALRIGSGSATDYVVRGNTISATDTPLEIEDILGNLIIENNQIGTDINGDYSAGFENNRDGIELVNSSGTNNTDERIQIIGNRIVSSSEDGISLLGNNSNLLIQGNFIGIDNSGATPGNGEAGLFVPSGTTNLEIGGLGNENVFVNNSEAGILFNGLAAVPSGTVVGVNSYYCNGTEGIDFTLTPLVNPAVVTYLSGSEISGTSTAADGSVVDIYETNASCTDNQGTTYIGQASVSSGLWSLSTTITASNFFTTTVTDPSDGISEFSMAVSEMVPDMVIYEGSGTTGTEITDGQATPFDFGSAEQGTDLTMDFTIENAGNVTLNIADISSSNLSYTFLSVPTTIAVGNIEVVSVTLDGSVIGTFNTTISIDSDDPDENPFTFPIIGEITAPLVPEIAVFVGNGTAGTELVDGQVASVDVGSGVINSDITQPITIENQGTSVLTITAISSSDPSFSITNAPTNISVGAAATFDVVLDGTTDGAFTTEISIASDDADENPFTFPVNGEITLEPEPEIALYLGANSGGTSIINGQLTEIDFGTAEVGENLSQNFTIENRGSATLTINAILADATEFSISSAPASVGVGLTETFNVTLDGSAAGLFSATISIVSDDSDESSFIFPVTGQIESIEEPEVSLYDNGALIENRSTLIFGETPVEEPLTRTFILENTSLMTDLTINSIYTQGSEYSILSSPSTVAVGTSADLIVELMSGFKGVYEDSLIIESNFVRYSILLRGEVIPKNLSIHVFNVVTPNGDGVHDFLRIQRITEHPNNRVSIFNRAGKLIYEASGYNNEDVRFEGKGNDGKVLLAGTYYYVVELDKGNREAGFLQIITD